jgi:hypothetical protein
MGNGPTPARPNGVNQGGQTRLGRLGSRAELVKMLLMPALKQAVELCETRREVFVQGGRLDSEASSHL